MAKKRSKQPGRLPPHPDFKKSFASPFRDGDNSLAKAIEQAVIEINKLKPKQENGGAFLGTNSALTIDFKKVKKIPKHTIHQPDN
jgi:hypothetical protein